MGRQQTQLVFIRHVLYRLKRRYGVPVTFYKRGTPTNDLMSGTTTVFWTTYVVRRGILFPSLWQRKFDYDLAYIASNNNFTYGGLFDKDIRRLIIDARDLPEGVEWTQDDEVLTEDRIYALKEVSEFERKRGFVFYLEEKRNPEPEKAIAGIANNSVTLTSTAVGTL